MYQDKTEKDQRSTRAIAQKRAMTHAGVNNEANNRITGGMNDAINSRMAPLQMQRDPFLTASRYQSTQQHYQPAQQGQTIQRKPNTTGLPDNLKSGIESLSGYSMDDVNVHYNSPKPAQMHAHAYAQGTDIHLGAGQEKHLPHEAWHVVQQKQGRVKPTMQMKGKVNRNNKGKRWQTNDFLRHYMFGGGKKVDLGAIGLGVEFQNAPTVKDAVNKFINTLMQAPALNINIKERVGIDVTMVGKKDFTGFPSLFSLGNGILNMSASCTSDFCQFDFEINDRFIDAFDIHDQWKGNQDIPFSSPYEIHYKWTKIRSYK